MKVLRINGVDFTPYIKPRMKYGWNALDGDEAGRTLDGIMRRDWISDKTKIEISLIPINDETFWSFDDFFRGAPDLTVEFQGSPKSKLRTINCYNSSLQGALYTVKDNDALWTDASFNLIEK